MSVYPEPPETNTTTSPPGSGINVWEEKPPELPSHIWPKLIGLGAIIAAALQIWSLFGLLRAGRIESEFQARIAAWETANQNRQKAFDTWNSIEKQINTNIDQQREQSSLLQGTIESLMKQRDQMVQTTASQSKTLEALQSSRTSLQTELETLRTELADANVKKNSIDGSIALTEEERKRLEQANNSLAERSKQTQEALTALEEEIATTDAKAEAKKKLLEKSTADLAAMEAKLVQFDDFLQSKIATAADFKLQQAKSAQAVKDLEATVAELEKQKAAVTKSTAQLADLTKQLADLTAVRDQGDANLNAVKSEVQKAEATLADLKKRELELSQRMTAMTQAMNTAASDATQSLTELSNTAASTIKEMAAKAMEVRKAVNEIKALPESSNQPSDPETRGEGSAMKDEGGK
jgi:chromosome segregation ATPase